MVPTVAVLLVVEDVITDTVPDGVTVPLYVVDVPENVGWLTVPAGV